MSATRASGIPRTRQRIHKKPAPLDVPDIDKDAAERKRVLNVLAQRRYREKRRLKGLRIEKSNLGSGHDDANEKSSPGLVLESPPADVSEATPSLPSSHAMNVANGFDEIEEVPLQSQLGGSWDIGLESLPPSFMSLDQTLPGLIYDDNALSSGIQSDTTFLEGSISNNSISPTLSNWAYSPSAIGSISSSASTGTEEFPDSYLLPVHELSILKAFLRIADRIGCTGQLWSLQCESPFNTNTSAPHATLPENWRPTTSQIIIPHHPLVDFLPWPSVRDRLLAILTLPEDERPPSAGGAMAFVNLVYDLEDNSEGIRIYGGDPYDEQNWEVGQVLFERWWFLFDRRVIERSNQWRELRGAPALRLTGGSG